MAHVIYSINVTASGLCHHLDSATGEAHHQYALDLTSSAEALVFGRNTFDLFMQFWPDAVNRSDLPEGTVALAQAFDAVPKYVISSQPVALTWKNTRHLQGPDLEGARKELEKLEGSVVIFGSPGLATSLLNEGLVNEIHILAQPYIGVEGPHVFDGLKKRVALGLLDAMPMPEGSVLLRYSVT